MLGQPIIPNNPINCNQQKQRNKAAKWLDKRCKNAIPVVNLHRDGYAQFIAYVYILKLSETKKVWYCVDLNLEPEEEHWCNRGIKKVRRICV